MKTTLTLQEKLRDLRDERKLTLVELAETTNIPLSTLQRLEGQDDVRGAYQDVAALAKFYDVSTDYLFGLTDNRQHRSVEIDAISLSDNAIEVLKSKKLNNRLVSELLSHDDFHGLLSAIEVYIDKKMLPQMNAMNAAYKLAETTIKENFQVDGRDEILEFLQNSVIDEDEFLRYRISERFNGIMKSLFDAHRKDPMPPEQAEALEDMKKTVQVYLEQSKTVETEKAKAIALCSQLGLDASALTMDEWQLLMKMIKRSGVYKQNRAARRGKKGR